MRFAIMAGCLLFVAAAFADDRQQAPAAQPAAPAPPKRICRTMYHNGGLVRTQTCKTKEEWDQERIRAQRNVSDFQNRNYQTQGH